MTERTRKYHASITEYNRSDAGKEARRRYRATHPHNHIYSYKVGNSLHKIRFGMDGISIAKILGDSCYMCGITGEEHKSKFKRNLGVHHIDGNGRNSQSPNNTVDNLRVVCLRCHAKIHKLGTKEKHRWKNQRVYRN